MSAPQEPPLYKGEPLDSERGPGLGCFWIQIALLTFFLVFTPLTVTWGWDSRISGALLIFSLILLLFSGQTIIFLLRLVAADRRTRRTPLDPSARLTVGQMEDTAPEVPPGQAESAVSAGQAESAVSAGQAPAEQEVASAGQAPVSSAGQAEPAGQALVSSAGRAELSGKAPVSDEEPAVSGLSAALPEAVPDEELPTMRTRDDG